MTKHIRNKITSRSNVVGRPINIFSKDTSAQSKRDCLATNKLKLVHNRKETPKLNYTENRICLENVCVEQLCKKNNRWIQGRHTYKRRVFQDIYKDCRHILIFPYRCT